jgi:hypothetical protein
LEVDDGVTFEMTSNRDNLQYLKHAGENGIVVYGTILIDGITITSWDISDEDVIQQNINGTIPRGYVRSAASEGSQILNSEFGYLGDVEPGRRGFDLFGEGPSHDMMIRGSKFHDMWMAFKMSAKITALSISLKGSLLSIVFLFGNQMHPINKKNNNRNFISASLVATFFTLAIIVATSIGAAPSAATTAATTTMPQPVTATTDNQSVNVLISWQPTEIMPGEESEFTLDFQDPSSGDSIPHVNYNFEIVDQNGGTVESMTDLHTHSGSDEQTVTFDNPGSFNLVATIIGTGIDPPFDTTQSGTAQTIIPVGQQQLPGAVDGNNATTAAATEEEAAATTTTGDTTTTNTTSPSGIELSPEPVHQEQQTLVSEIPINETHNQFTFSGNGTLNLPNGTINITSTGSVIASMDGTAVGEETLTTEDGIESATATFYAIGRFNMEDGSGRNIIIALVNTNSTGQLAPLNGAIVAGEIEFLPDQTSLVTLWEWQSGIPLPTSTTNSMEELPALNTTTMTTTYTTNTNTNTTTADGSNATAIAPAPLEEEEEDAVEEQQQQATPTAPSPLFE